MDKNIKDMTAKEYLEYCCVPETNSEGMQYFKLTSQQFEIYTKKIGNAALLIKVEDQ